MKTYNNEELAPELQKILVSLVEKYEQEDEGARKLQIKAWKEHDSFWHGMQYVFWNEIQQEWVDVTGFIADSSMEEGRDGFDTPLYDYVINIYRPHGESIIAALGAQTPAVRFPPDDAENEDDLMTSKTFGKVADVIQRHNQAPVMRLRAWATLFNEGNIFAYVYRKSDPKYGMTQIEKYEPGKACPMCEEQFGEEMETCPTCMDLDSQPIPLTSQPVQVGTEEVPKSRLCIDLYGNIDVKVPRLAIEQKDCDYLIHTAERSKAFVKSLYPHIREQIDGGKDYGQEDRLPNTFPHQGTWENQNYVTMRRVWLRPWVFEDLGEAQETEREQLKKLFPKGCYVCLINDTYAESRDEDLDDHWTIGFAGLSKKIHADPMGQPLIQIQKLRNALVNLTQETVEHGIPSGFADPDVLDFSAYAKHESRPGVIYPAKPKTGQQLAQAFYETGRATLSREVPIVMDRYDKDAQFCSGAFPSIYGGPGEGNSRTAAEYNMSRQMALQRLSISWTLFAQFWAKMIERSVRLYVEGMNGDERHVLAEGRGENTNYVNIWIKQSELQGKVGEVEPEASETFPISTPQKQALLLRLLELQNDFLNTAIFDTENRRLIADVLAYPDIHIPGEDQRIKQVREIQQMLRGEAVMIDPLVDDDEVHISTLKNFLVSPKGLDLKQRDPNIYGLITMHLNAHTMNEQAKTMQQFGSTLPGEPPGPAVQ